MRPKYGVGSLILANGPWNCNKYEYIYLYDIHRAKPIPYCFYEGTNPTTGDWSWGKALCEKNTQLITDIFCYEEQS